MQIVDIEEPGQEEHKSEIIVGIDFGTTNSLIAVSKNRTPVVIKLENGMDFCPSVIALDGSQNFKIGEQKNARSLRSIKRYLSKTSDQIQMNDNLMLQSDLINLDETIPRILVGDKLVSFTELASQIFIYLANAASIELKSDIKKIVLSVPAHFDDNARGQVILAAKVAGLEVVRLISEPTAAAYAYSLNKKKEGSYLVYDLGGGTFDISILNMDQGVLQVIATDGNNMLGGDDIDLLLSKHVAKKHSLKITDMFIACMRSIKEQLSRNRKAEARFENITIIVTRDEFESIITPIIQKTINMVSSLLSEFDEIELDGIILVGGSTRIPLIKEKLKSSFGVKILDDLDPDKIVALGAAMQAENLSTKSSALLIDVLPLSIGLQLYGGIVEKIIMRNTPIPFSITKEFTTHMDNQTGIKLHILQGEREMVDDCLSLAHFELSGIRPQKAGRARLEVTFAVDADGILSVSARDCESGKVKNITVNPTYEVTEDTVLDNLKSAYQNAQKDHQLKILLETKSNAESLIYGLENALQETPDVITKNEYQQIKEQIDSLKLFMQNDNRDKILDQMNHLNKLAENFIQKHLDQGANTHLKGRSVNEIKID